MTRRWWSRSASRSARSASPCDDGSINIARGPADSPDVILETDPPTLEHLAFFGLAVDDAERQGDLVVHGDRALVPRFFDLFPVPRA